MKKLIKNILYTLVMLTVLACSKDDNTPLEESIDTEQEEQEEEQQQEEDDIYVIGYSFEGGSSKPVYWENGEEFALTFIPNAIHISKTNDVYIAGIDNGKAVYWKNGKKIILPSLGHGVDSAQANDIAVSNSGDVYIVGDLGYGSNDFKAVYWKNGSRNNLSPNDKAITTGIHITPNGDVYISGTDNDNHKAVYWKNGIKAILSPNSNLTSSAKSIYVTDTGDVYVAGEVDEGSGTNGIISRGVYWKNGEQTILSSSDKITQTHSIYVANNKVYVCGAEKYANVVQSKWSAVYWEGPTKFDLTGGNESRARQIIVVDNDVYIAGKEKETSINKAVYWKNGIKTTLTDGSSTALANGIAITSN